MVQNVRSTGATFSSITLRWDELGCVDRNGPLTGYRIEYSTTNTETVTAGASNTSFTVTGLDPSTTYVFDVVAVNSNHIGTATTTINSMTLPSG